LSTVAVLRSKKKKKEYEFFAGRRFALGCLTQMSMVTRCFAVTRYDLTAPQVMPGCDLLRLSAAPRRNANDEIFFRMDC